MIILHTLISDHKGAGTRTLQKLCAFADMHGETIIVSADSNLPSKGFDHSYEKTAKLVDWYRSYGFKACDRDYWDGKNRYQVNVMERLPRLIAPPYLTEHMLYERLHEKHRWVFDKLELARRLGTQAWPVGLKFPTGEYCVRPSINLQGMAKGGFRKVVLDTPAYIQEPVGYVVTPWNSGPRSWHQYVNDVWHNGHVQVTQDGEISWYEEVMDGPPLPEALRGISRYMLVERLGDEVIDVGPRHMVEQYRNSVVEDYRQFDPAYQVPDWCEYGFRPILRTFEKDGWFHHEEVEGYNDRPSPGFE